MPPALPVALGAIVIAGAALRFGTLGTQHYWLDEAVTGGLLRQSLGDMLATIPKRESTPPLYYLLARAWTVVFGQGEPAVKAFSALAGTATIPLAYAAATELTGRRTGLAVAALAAVSPALIWYSQEARSYALLVLFGAASVLFLARALRRDDRLSAWWWAASAALAVLSHYFAAFLVAAEALCLLASPARRRAAAPAVAAVVLVGLALAPLALHQREQGNLDFIQNQSLPGRTFDLGELFLLGQTGRPLSAGVVVLALLSLAAVALLARADAGQRRSVRVPLALAAVGLALPLLLAPIGLDYVLPRNLLALWLPAAIVVSVGLTARDSPRLGAAVTVALVAGGLWQTLDVQADRTRQREALTATLTPGTSLDARADRIAPRVTYRVPLPGRPLRAAALCPAGYSARAGGAAWLSVKADEPVSSSAPLPGRRGWAVALPADESRGRPLSLYAICVKPRAAG